jgi:hypothetical protein
MVRGGGGVVVWVVTGGEVLWWWRVSLVWGFGSEWLGFEW